MHSMPRPFSELLADYGIAFNQNKRILRLRLAASVGIAAEALLPEHLSGSY